MDNPQSKKQYRIDVLKTREDYLNEKYPGFRGPEYASEYFSPIISGPANVWITIRKLLAGFGIFMVIVKMIQGTP